ncbi:LysE family transporter [Thalassobaculum sp.]|uniref:LysE family translocator n=1 Tax=Thalassobaculum sp. TaxID=2022740 RepID=UPI0032EC2783
MDLLVILSSIVLANLIAWITPGPNMIAVMSASLTGGRRAGLLTGLGLSAGATVWAGLAVLGVATLFELFPNALLALRLAGAGYLLWLGFRSLRAALLDDTSGLVASVGSARTPRAFRTGLLVSLTNPKAALFFGSILTAFVPIDASPALLGGIVALCAVLAVTCHSVTATLFSAGRVIRAFERMRRTATALFGVVFAGLGLAVAWDSIRRL